MAKEIKFLRRKIDRITEKIIKLIAERRKVVLEIGRIKEEKRIPILDQKREKESMFKVKKLSKENKIPSALIEKITKILIENGRRLQKK